MENEKLFDMMQIMYHEMKEGFTRTDGRFEALENRFDNLEGRFDNLENRFNSLEIEMHDGFAKHDKRFDRLETKIDAVETKADKTNFILEHEIMPKVSALFDGYTQHTQDIYILNGKVDMLRKSVNDIEIKTLATDNMVLELSQRVK